MEIDVSVVVPCFNAERFVEQTVASALAQGDDVEVIVVDDGSTDRSAHVVQGLAERTDRLRLYSGPNRGVSAARNRGLGARSPSSRFVLFLDADDVLAPAAIGSLRDRLERESELGAVVGTCSRMDAAGVLIEPAPDRFLACHAERRGVRTVVLGDRMGYWDIAPTNPITTPGQCLIRVESLAGSEPFDSRLSPSEDWDLWLRLARRRAIGVEHHEVLSYRHHEAGASKRYDAMHHARAAVLQRQLELVSSDEGPRLRTAWRYAMFQFDAQLSVRWARERLMARDLTGSARYFLRWLRGEARYLRAVALGQPELGVTAPRH